MSSKTTSSYKNVASTVDADLRKYMLSVFSHMSVGLGITALVSYLVSRSPQLMSVFFSNMLIFWIVALIPLGIAFYLTSRLATMSVDKARNLFFAYAACVGLSLSSIFMVYSGTSVVSAFFVTSSMFLSMVIYGYVTEKDLTSWGSILMMGVVGLIICSIVNVFLHSSMFSLVVSAIGVVLFTGLTAYDTQIIKSYYFDSDAADVSEKKAILGALRLYLDFINLFMHILRLMGSRRGN